MYHIFDLITIVFGMYCQDSYSLKHVNAFYIRHMIDRMHKHLPNQQLALLWSQNREAFLHGNNFRNVT